MMLKFIFMWSREEKLIILCVDWCYSVGFFELRLVKLMIIFIVFLISKFFFCKLIVKWDVDKILELFIWFLECVNRFWEVYEILLYINFVLFEFVRELVNIIIMKEDFVIYCVFVFMWI